MQQMTFTKQGKTEAQIAYNNHSNMCTKLTKWKVFNIPIVTLDCKTDDYTSAGDSFLKVLKSD